MPRIAVAIFVVVAVSVSIGINIVRYPAVFQAANSTHESLVSNDTTDVSEAKETEGPVAVNAIPALPDTDLAKWNPPVATGGVQSTITEEVPHVASSRDPANTRSGEELNDYEVQPYRPYTSRPPVETPSPALADTPSEPETNNDGYQPDTQNSTGGDAHQPEVETSPSDYKTERQIWGDTSDSSTGDPSTETETVSPTSPGTMPNAAAMPEKTLPGQWPATVNEPFRYDSKPENVPASPTNGTVDTSEQVVSYPASNVTSFESGSLSQQSTKPIFEEQSDWEASVPMVAIRTNHASPVSLDAVSYREIKRLPAVQGADALPGALPSSRPMDYPVVE